MGASVVTGMDAPPVLKLCEHVFDPMALLIERLLVEDRDFPVFL